MMELVDDFEAGRCSHHYQFSLMWVLSALKALLMARNLLPLLEALTVASRAERLSFLLCIDLPARLDHKLSKCVSCNVQGCQQGSAWGKGHS